jgi:hypothetical protein
MGVVRALASTPHHSCTTCGPPQGCSASPLEDNFFRWNATVVGPDETPWEGAGVGVAVPSLDSPGARVLCCSDSPEPCVDPTRPELCGGCHVTPPPLRCVCGLGWLCRGHFQPAPPVPGPVPQQAPQRAVRVGDVPPQRVPRRHLVLGHHSGMCVRRGGGGWGVSLEGLCGHLGPPALQS